MIIAIDGPAASGKGTVAKRLAKYYNLAYLDTGSIYRAIGYNILKNGLDPNNRKVATAAAKNLDISDLKSEHLYDEGVGAAASIISAIPKVRQLLLDFQKNFAKDPKGAVLDGRDIGTVICPQADCKFFISADLDKRAMRRFKQLQTRDNTVIYETVLEDLKRRDFRDRTRKIAPLRPALDAVFIDTSHMDEDQVFNLVVDNVESKLPALCSKSVS